MKNSLKKRKVRSSKALNCQEIEIEGAEMSFAERVKNTIEK